MAVIADATAKSIENYIKGSITATQLMLETPSFQASLNHYLESGNAGDLEQYVYTIASNTHPAIREVALCISSGDKLISTMADEQYSLLNTASGTHGSGKLSIYQDRSGNLFVGFFLSVDPDLYFLSFLDVASLYQRTASSALLGEKGYVMIKNSDGIILMHPTQNQLGKHVLEDRSLQWPELYYTDLERLIAAQTKGETSIMIYRSYWWGDDYPTNVKKSALIRPPWFRMIS